MKDAPLGTYLAALPASKSEVSLRFAEIEKIIGTGLPPSASSYREWWANQEHGSRAPHWQGAGFLDSVDLSRGLVRFRRTGAAKSAKAPAAVRPALTAQRTEKTIHDESGRSKG